MAISVDPTTGAISGAESKSGVLLPAVTGTLKALNAATPVIVTVAGSEAYNTVTLTVQNIDASATVYLGGSNVTSSSYGYKLVAGASYTLTDIPVNLELYAISSGSSSVAVLNISR